MGSNIGKLYHHRVSYTKKLIIITHTSSTTEPLHELSNSITEQNNSKKFGPF